MENLNDLYFFVQAVEHGGFAPAGRALGVPKSKLSRRVALLEKRLGVRLIHRSTRRFVLTDVGRRYFTHCQAMLVEADAAQEVIDSLTAEPAGVIRLTCPIGLLNFHIGEMLARFLAQCPNVSIQLEATNRHVDVIGEGMDMAIRVRPRPLEDSDLALRVLSDRGQCLVANPTLAERMGLPDKPEDLSNWPSLSRAVPQENHAWVLENAAGETVTVQHTPRYITTDMLALKAAALAGVGVAQLPVLMLSRELESGALVSVLPQWRPPREVIHIVFPSRRGMLPSVRALIDFLVDSYRGFEED
ncbi:DNA-binding transcriptional LysR family regulator [Natronocella acetinitrilica]|uniref:DNA-binding transcriptional LysR family regulator n=1 Tax=Natronocella acetinitrilica TaxID=414046 RepID=A0AAE3G7E9_9GAMM|nr:LysR family transcriptional regulator [Natronocella acetinitrilica]MCP1676433.1 DNA-binding transcriptional LysR family regulator [Natronocella acetinitrilica]